MKLLNFGNSQFSGVSSLPSESVLLFGEYSELSEGGYTRLDGPGRGRGGCSGRGAILGPGTTIGTPGAVRRYDFCCGCRTILGPETTTGLLRAVRREGFCCG